MVPDMVLVRRHCVCGGGGGGYTRGNAREQVPCGMSARFAAVAGRKWPTWRKRNGWDGGGGGGVGRLLAAMRSACGFNVLLASSGGAW